MKINFDVTPIELKIIRGILSNYLYSNCKVWVFGSRAKTSSLHGSDLDLALDCINKMDLKLLNKIKSDLENSRLPYKVDVVDIHGVKPYFKEIIDKEKIPLPVETKRETPLLRFKEFSGKWKEKQLKEISKINPSTQELPNKFTYIDLESVKQGQLIKLNNMFKSKAPSRAQRRLFKNDILFQTVRPYQKNNYFFDLDGDYVASTGYAQIRANESSKFLYQKIYTYNFTNKVLMMCTGTNYPAINSSDVSKLKISLPKKLEQNKIASFLTLIDTRIEQLNMKHQLLEKYKKAITQNIFSQNIRFKNDVGSEFECWKIKVFEELFNSVSGTALEEFADINSTHRFISIGNYGIEGQYIDNGQRVALNEKTKTKLLNKNDLVMVLNDKTLSGDIIGSTILIHQNDKYIYNQRSERLICNDNIMPLFAWYYLNSLKFRKKVFTVAQGGTQIYINFSSIKKFKINLPPFKEQTKIANFLSSIDEKITNSSKKINQVKKFKKSLLQQMFI